MTYKERVKLAQKRNNFALWLTTAMATVFGWLYAEKAGAIIAFLIWVGAVVMPRSLDAHPFGFIRRNFLQPQQLPWTMVNIVLATLCGYMIWGIDAPFYVALIGVPIVVLTLTLTVLDLDPQPESDEGTNQD